MCLVAVEDATFAYTATPVFARISLRVGRGELFVLLGPNGCGKTTLLDCIIGFNRLRQGRILLQGRNIARLGPRHIARSLAYVPQLHVKTFPYRVVDVVAMGRAGHLHWHRQPGRHEYALAEQMLRHTGIWHLRNRPYTQLSGGEGQLVMIARALVQQAPCIVMDEPTTHLDLRNELVVLEQMVRLIRDRGISVIMATHAPNHVFYFMSQQVPVRLALLHDGNFMAAGSPADVLTETNLARLYDIDTRIINAPLPGLPGSKLVVPLATRTKGDH